jgi:P27 family predicted phage terminase small subunit
VPVLQMMAGLTSVDRSTAVDYCVCVARLEWCERQLSIEGLVTMGQRGPCRNPLTTIASQYRTQLKAYIGELGLSPSARGRLTPPEGGDDGDDDDPFD